MSASRAEVPYAVGLVDLLATNTPTLSMWVKWLTPRQGWTTFALWLATAGVVAWTVRGAGWVETPGLMPVVFLSSAAGLLLSKIRARRGLMHFAAFGLGLVFVFWQTLSLIEAQPLDQRVGVFWDRLSTWYEAARTGGLTTDLLPLAIAVMAAVWLLSYVGAWFIFRRNNVWIGLLLLGTIFMTTREYTSDSSAGGFYLFLFASMLLVARVTLIQRDDRRRLARFESVRGTSRPSLGVTAAASVLLLGAVAGLPGNPSGSDTFHDLWQLGRSPVYWVEAKFERMYLGTGVALGGRYFQDSLFFEGPRSTSEEIVFVAESEYPTYWLSHAYNRYTSGGWASGRTMKRYAGPESLDLLPHKVSSPVAVTQTLEVNVATSELLSGGNIEWISRESEFETLEPMQFEIDLSGTVADGQLPADVARLAAELARRFSPVPAGFVESNVSDMLPEDLRLVKPSFRADGAGRSHLEKVTLARAGPVAPDVVSWRSLEQLGGGDSYSMRSLVSRASYQDLRGAGTDYAGFVTDHYLALPATLPDRVRELSRLVTQGARTPLDKAMSIQDFLRSDRFTYSVDVEKPPRDADGVDYFLFETMTGYCDYFASAMVVMLRAVGVPARLAAGYGPGEEADATGLREVRSTDAHSWPQVYFPGHGWIDFEPTPIWPVPDRGPVGTGQPGSESGAADQGRGECFTGFMPEVPCIDDEELSLLESNSAASALAPSVQALGADASRSTGELLTRLSIAGAAVAVLSLAVWLAWTLSLVRVNAADAAYAKMTRIGFLGGIRRRAHQTPLEYATALGDTVPRVHTGAQAVAGAFAAERYGKQTLNDQERRDLHMGWKSIRGPLLARVVRRLVRPDASGTGTQ